MLNEVKHLSESKTVDRHVDLEIFRFAQDDSCQNKIRRAESHSADIKGDKSLVASKTLLYNHTILKFIANNSRLILTPICCTLICIHRTCWHIDLATTAVIVKNIGSAQCRRCCNLAIYTCQAVAIIECPLSNRRYAITDSNTCQAVAKSECITSNRHYAIRDIHTCQAVATFECPPSNRRYAIRDSNTCQAVAIIE